MWTADYQVGIRMLGSPKVPSKTFHFEANLKQVLEVLDDDEEASTALLRLLRRIAEEVPYQDRALWLCEVALTHRSEDFVKLGAQLSTAVIQPSRGGTTGESNSGRRA